MGRLLFLIFLFYPVLSTRAKTELKQEHNLPKVENLREVYSETQLSAQSDTSHPENFEKRKTILFPLGDVSFADSVILYDPGAMGQGTGDEPDVQYQHPGKALGPPSENQNPHAHFVSLGKGGSLVLQFKDNVLIDSEGPDLHIQFAQGDTEEVKVWISKDGQTFRYVSKASAHSSDMDISRVTEQGEFFSYVKIRDEVFQGEDEGPRIGADIDAVGALHTAMRFVISTSSLFQNDLDLNESAGQVLAEVNQSIQSLSNPLVLIHTHTDNRGSADLNLIRSQSQADALHYYFLKDENLIHARYSVVGWGESNPGNTQNQDKNNRVEIFILIQ